MSIKLINTTNKKGEWNITFTAVRNHACHTIYSMNTMQIMNIIFNCSCRLMLNA